MPLDLFDSTFEKLSGELEREPELKNSLTGRFNDLRRRELFERMMEQLEKPEVQQLRARAINYYNFQSAEVSFGQSLSLSKGEEEGIRKLHEILIPWRKGPYCFFNRHLDAEWRSDWKWNRLAPSLPALRGLSVADVGASNGYYAFRLIAGGVRRIVAFEPNDHAFLTLTANSYFAQTNKLVGVPLGDSALEYFKSQFDLLICLGVIYHCREPEKLLQRAHRSLKPGGDLLLETIVLPDSEVETLVPQGRYAQMRNVYCVPTIPELVKQLNQSNFTSCKLVSMVKTTLYEQRVTAFGPTQSLRDFLDPNDQTRTSEGYPAPWRAIIVAKRG